MYQVFSFVFFRDFIVWVRRCVVCRLVWRCLISRLVAVFVCFIFSQSQIRSMIWTPTLQIWKHEYSGDLDFIFFGGISPLYAINLDVMSLFADSSFTFLAMLILMYSINLNEWISFCFCQKKSSFREPVM